jgi:hypothetical protein
VPRPFKEIALTGPLAVPHRAPQLASAVATRWGRLLIPSITDLLFVAILSWLFVAGEFGWKGLLNDGDTGWHIRTGEYVLDTGTVPRTDLFSFSKPGEPWFAWEWGADVVLALLHRALGLKGVVLWAAVWICLFAALLARRMAERGAGLFVVVPLLLLGVGGSSMHFLARPHLFSLIFLLVTAWLVERDRARPDGWIWTLAPVLALWTNLHGAFPAGIVVIGAAAAGSGAEAWLGGERDWRKWRQARRYLAVAGAAGLATLANPFGWGVHAHIWGYLRSDWIRNVVQEFQAPDFRSENAAQFEALLFLALLAVPGLLRRREITPALWILGFGHLALTSARHIPVFVAVCTPWIAAEAEHWWQGAMGGAGRKSLRTIFASLSRDLTPGLRRTSIWGFVAVAALAGMGEPVKWPADFPAEMFPTGMVARHGELLRTKRVLTVDQWADYLIYRHYPQQRVFVDGRSDFYGPGVGGEYLGLMNGRHDWRALLEKHRFEAALVPPAWPLSSLLKLAPEWRVVEDDGKAILFERAQPISTYWSSGGGLKF